MTARKGSKLSLRSGDDLLWEHSRCRSLLNGLSFHLGCYCQYFRSVFKFFICPLTFGKKILYFLNSRKNLPVVISKRNPQPSHHHCSWLQLQQQRCLQAETPDKVTTTWWQRPVRNQSAKVLTTSVTGRHENSAYSSHTQKSATSETCFLKPSCCCCGFSVWQLASVRQLR